MGDPSQRMRKQLFWLGIGGAASLLSFLFFRSTDPEPGTPTAPMPGPGAVPLLSPASSGRQAPTAPGGGEEEVLGLVSGAGEKIRALTARLSPRRDLERDAGWLAGIREVLEELAVRLRALPNDLVAEAIRAYLESGEDVTTGLGFKVGEGGLLRDAPSMRMFLLDLLADVDAPAAVTESMALLEESASPGEWALALRNIAWQDGQGKHREFLRGKLSEMLDRQEWLAHPDPGFLEAFDLAVHLGDEEALREMGSVLGLRNQQGGLADNGITHAAFLAMDRLTALDPAQTVGLIQSEPDFLGWAPRHRGALMSRADVRDPQQAVDVAGYLLRPDVAPEERRVFLELFPQANGVLADSLISAPGTPLEFSSGLARDRAALEWVRGRLAEARFQGLRGELLAAEARLRGFVER